MTPSRTALSHYCERLGYSGALRADIATLQQLHALHPQAIPFENLNSWLGQPVAMEPEAIFAKLVLQRRGGYCFEQNQLFMQMLQALGFSVQGLAARVLWNQPATSRLARTHMLLLVTIDGVRHIADVGFGGLTMTAALQLDTDVVQQSPHEKLRISREGDHHLVQAFVADSWKPLYRFSLEAQMPADYAMANWYVSTHPESRFVSQLIAGRADPDCRHALLNMRYSRHFADRPSEQQILDSPAAVRTLLEESFQIDTAALPGLDLRLATLFTGA